MVTKAKAPAIEAVALPQELALELQELTQDPFFYRRVQPERRQEQVQAPPPSSSLGAVVWGAVTGATARGRAGAGGRRSASVASSASAAGGRA